MKNQTLLSGIAPSGNLHIGNYLGALKQWVDLQKDYTVFAMVADLHAITVPKDPEVLHKKTLEMAKIMVASGIDPEKSVVFLQSHVPAHAELGWILNTLTPVGELERMTQFKEKKAKAGVLAGLLNYPTLMAADILLYQADAVPVGDDQDQHLELTRTLARKFNNKYGEIFKEPRALIHNDTRRIMALDDPTQKMSKSAASHNNYIAILDPEKEIRKKIKAAVTTSAEGIRFNAMHNPAELNLLNIYSAFSGIPTNKIIPMFSNKGHAAFKAGLADIIVEKLVPIQKQYEGLSDSDITDILKSGAKKAAEIANKTLREVKEQMGFVV